MVIRQRTGTASADSARPQSRPSDASPRHVVGEIVDQRREAAEKQLRALAWLLDDSIEIPGLRWRIGLDGLIGLIPGLGDLVTTGLSAMIIRQAAILGVPKIVLTRMACNTLLDFVLGAIPLVGDIFDFAWKANRRNAQLALQHLNSPQRARKESWLSVGGLLLLVVGLVLAAGAVIGGLIAAVL